MNIKLYLGILLPLVVIVILVVLSNSNIGFSVERENAETISFSSLFSGQSAPRDNVLVQTITMNNNFFMPRRFALPKLIACLNDKEGVKKSEMLQARYSDADSQTQVYGGISGYYSAGQSIELPANSKKQVKVLIDSKYVTDTAILLYAAYDEVLLIEAKENRQSRISCTNLEAEELDSAIHVNIIE